MIALRPSARSIRLEASTRCQLRCPSCATTHGLTERGLGSGFLSLARFRRLLDESPGIRDVELSNWGEMFLNPELADILALAWARGVASRADNGVNLNHVRPGALEALVRYRLRSMTCSIDGASQETYARYRRGGSFEAVLGHLRELNALKRRLGSFYPLLRWQFIAFAHNVHELDRARRLAAELGMSFMVKSSHDAALAPAERVPVPGGELQSTGLMTRKICAQLWNQPQVNWDGRMLGCCVNQWGDYGNVFREGLENVLHGERMAAARRMLLGRLPARPDVPCASCHVYREMRAAGAWLSQGEVLGYRVAVGVQRLLSRRGWLPVRNALRAAFQALLGSRR